jgi:hypothetical protein
MPEQARLRVHGQGSVEVELVTAFLTDLKHAYDSVLLFEATTGGMRRGVPQFPFSFNLFGWDSGWLHAGYWPPKAEGVASRVPRSEELILSAVSLTSPGFWEFLGTINPLEILRKYLNDRHERRKDHEYRESAEQRRLALENLSLENRVIAERVRIAKEIGATDRDLAPLLNELIYRPLVALDRYQDKGVIENAEIVTHSGASEIDLD